MIDISEKQRGIIVDIFHRIIPECEARAYGSRINGTSHAGSDLDIAIIGEEELGWKKIVKLKEAFEESNLPFRVDILDWHRMPESFKKNIEEEYEVIYSGRDDEV